MKGHSMCETAQHSCVTVSDCMCDNFTVESHFVSARHDRHYCLTLLQQRMAAVQCGVGALCSVYSHSHAHAHSDVNETFH